MVKNTFRLEQKLEQIFCEPYPHEDKEAEAWQYRIFNDIRILTQDDTMQLILEAETEEEKEFYEMIGNYLLQRKQQECIARNVF